MFVGDGAGGFTEETSGATPQPIDSFGNINPQMNVASVTSEAADLNGDGELQFEEFYRAIRKELKLPPKDLADDDIPVGHVAVDADMGRHFNRPVL